MKQDITGFFEGFNDNPVTILSQTGENIQVSKKNGEYPEDIFKAVIYLLSSYPLFDFQNTLKFGKSYELKRSKIKNSYFREILKLLKNIDYYDYRVQEIIHISFSEDIIYTHLSMVLDHFESREDFKSCIIVRKYLKYILDNPDPTEIKYLSN
jgi:hypothetical protein